MQLMQGIGIFQCRVRTEKYYETEEDSWQNTNEIYFSTVKKMKGVNNVN